MSNKESLVADALTLLLGNVPDYKKEIIELLKDALERKTIKELRELID